jgi:hypothetical protein
LSDCASIASWIRSLMSTAEIGCMAADSALAEVIMSG